MTDSLIKILDNSQSIKYSSKKEHVYQLVDFYSLFYFHFLKNKSNDDSFWSNNIDLPSRRNYFGLCFELLAKQHIKEIKCALGINGVSSTCCSLNIKGNETRNGCQIDLGIDRRDNTSDLVEIKFSLEDYLINKDYFDNLKNKLINYI